MKAPAVSTASGQPTAISLFAGADGCSLTLGEAGYDVRFASDLDADAVASYRRSFPGALCESADIRLLSSADLPERIGLKPGELDILLGGPPCPGLSSAGAKSGASLASKAEHGLMNPLDRQRLDVVNHLAPRPPPRPDRSATGRPCSKRALDASRRFAHRR